MSESAWIIPDDWSLADGEWQSLCIQWPKSEQWDLLLRSLFYTLSRGREWDRNTGVIKDAQAIGWQIFERNHDNPGCDNSVCPDCPDCGEPTRDDCASLGYGGSILIESEEDMGQVVTDVTLNDDGSLRIWFGKCCYTDLAIGANSQGGSDDLGDDPLNPNGDPNKEYSACSKATAITNAIFAVLNSAYDAASTPEVWKWVGQVESDLGYNLSDKWVVALIIDWIAYGLVINPEQVFSTNDRTDTICAMQNVFEDDAAGVPDNATYEAVKAAIHTQNFLYDGLIMSAVACLGRGNLDTIAKLGADDLDATCLCSDEIPDAETEPVTGGWYLSANMAADWRDVDPNDTLNIADMVNTLAEDAYGVFLVIEAAPGQGAVTKSAGGSYYDYVPPTTDAWCWNSGGTTLETLNLAYPLMSTMNSTIRQDLAASRGYSGAVDLGAGTMTSINVAAPSKLAGTKLAAGISHHPTTQAWGTIFKVIEFRWIFNTGSPSHA